MSLAHKTASPALTDEQKQQMLPPDVSPAEYIQGLFSDPVVIQRDILLRRTFPDGRMEEFIAPFKFKILSVLELDSAIQRAIRRTELAWKETIKDHTQTLYKTSYDECLSWNQTAEILALGILSVETGKPIFANVEQVLKGVRHNVEILWRYWQDTQARCSPTVDTLTDDLLETWFEWWDKGINTDFFLPLLDKPRHAAQFLAYAHSRIQAREAELRTSPAPSPGT